MPVLLAPERAPYLEDLLQAADTVGIGSQVEWPARANRRLQVAGIGTLSGAGGSEISFLSNPKLHQQLHDCAAAAVILRPDDWRAFQESAPKPSWVPVLCAQPYLLYALLAQWFDGQRQPSCKAGAHASAVVAPDAQIGADVYIGPQAVIEAGVVLARGVRIGAACVIGAGSSIGADSLLHARVTLYPGVKIGARAIIHSGVVLGADGFGFAPDPRTKGAWAKIAQLGGVSIGDDVEIGANTTIDRGALEDTVIENGVKLDNQIMIGHNCHIGAHTAMAACVGVAGSTTMGERCVIGGAAMFGGHLSLADDVHISGGTAVTSDVSVPGRYTGVFPLADHAAWQKNAAVLGQLAQLRKRLRSAERQASHAGAGDNKQDTN